MKKVIMIAAMAVSVSLSSMAQEQGRQEGRRFDRTEMIQRRTDMMAEQYGLDENQKAKLLELNQKYADSVPMMGRPGGRQGRGGDAQQRRQGPPPGAGNNAQAGQRQGRGPGRGNGPGRFDPEKMKEYEAALKGIMTEEQYAKYEADRNQRMQQRPNNGERESVQ